MTKGAMTWMNPSHQTTIMARMVGERGMAESAEAEGRMFPRTATTPMTTIPMGMEVEAPRQSVKEARTAVFQLRPTHAPRGNECPFEHQKGLAAKAKV